MTRNARFLQPLLGMWIPWIVAAGMGCAVAGTHTPAPGDGQAGSAGGGTGGSSPRGASGSGGIVSVTGSGGAGAGPGGGIDRGGPVPPTCTKIDFNIERRPAAVFLVQDRSGSMKNSPPGQTQTKWQLTTAAMIQAITQTDSVISWGLKTFPEGSGDCAVTAAIDVPVAAANATRVVAAINATTPNGNGTPTGDAIKQSVAYMAGLQVSGDKYMVLSTDGDPTCGSPSPIQYAVAQLQIGVSKGIRTFVIGIGTGSSSGPNLSMMAAAGGMPRPVVNPLDPNYYLANSQQELSAALAAITGQVISCTFPLANPPPLPKGVHVTVNGTEIYIDASHKSGWDYTDPAYSGLEIFGAQCDVIKAGSAQVHITYDCVPVIPT
jgi:von Willebrand factor type A domain